MNQFYKKMQITRHFGLAPQGHFLTGHPESHQNSRMTLKQKEILNQVQDDVETQDPKVQYYDV